MDKLNRSISISTSTADRKHNFNQRDRTSVEMDSLDSAVCVSDVSTMSAQATASAKMQTRCLPMPDPVKEAEVLDTIDAAYYIEDDFDATEYELKKMIESELLPEDLQRERERLKTQLQVVSKRISAKIMANSPSYSAQLADLDQIHKELSDAIAIIVRIRGDLGQAKSQSRNGLEILANHRNKKFLRRLKSSLKTVKTLYETEFQLKDLIQEGNFPAAITLCKEAQKAAATYSQFECIRELSEKLKCTVGDIEEGLDESLRSLTVLFDPDRYLSVYSAYSMLGKIKEVAVKIVGFVKATLESSARRVLVDRLAMRLPDVDLGGMSYEQLCEAVEAEQMLECVTELGFVVCKVLFTFHSILRFHVDEDERLNCTEGRTGERGAAQTALSESLYSVFKLASMKFNTLLCCHDLSTLKFDHFLDIVEMSNRFKHFGRLYFGNSCGEVSISLEKQTYLYFGRYHSERMAELRMFFENEAFALCPVPQQFTLFDLQEFHFLKESPDCRDDEESRSKVEEDAGLGEQLDFELVPPELPNPFSPEAKIKQKEVVKSKSTRSMLSDSDSDAPSTITDPRRSPSDSGSPVANGACSQFSPILCNTALNILRFFGRYIRMTYLLHSIADQAIAAITQLFNYFFYSVHSFFSEDGQDFGVQFASSRLLAELHAIRESLIYTEDVTRGSPQNNRQQQPASSLSPLVQLHYPDQVFALSERIVAVESLIFLAKQLDLIRPFVESLLSPGTSSAQLDAFYSKTLAVVSDVRESVYGCVASRALNYSQLIATVSATKWDIVELRSQHSPYVDFLLQDMQNFGKRLERISESIPIPRGVSLIIWDAMIHCAFKALVQGYCESSKKCTNEGRALMQLDLQQLVTKMEGITDIRPVPHKSFVENYIKAYYLPESSLEQWIQQHTEYTAHQMITLLNVATHVSKKARTRIINALDE